MFSQRPFKHLRKKIYLSNSGFIPNVFGVFFWYSMLLCNLQLQLNCKDDVPMIPIQEIPKFRFKSSP